MHFVCSTTGIDSELCLLVNFADNAGPTVTIVLASGSSPRSGTVASFTITFSETVTDFDLADVTTSGCTATLSGSGTTYTLDLTGCGDGSVTVDVLAGVAHDSAGSPNTAATQASVVFGNDD